MSQTDPKELFSATPIARLFFIAALPGAAGMLVSSIYGTMDGVFVGNFVGETAFAAINLAMPFVIVLFAFGDLIGVGSAVPISIALGERRDDDANNVFSCSCVMNVVTGAAMGTMLWLAAPHIMALMGAAGRLASDATTYLRVYAAFAPLTTIAYALDNYLRISGRIRRSLFANTFMAVFGAVVEFAMLGPLGLGVGAAALSYCLAMVASVVIALWPFVRGGLQLRFVKPQPSWAMVREVFSCGLSTFLDNVASRVSAIAMNAALLAMGGADAVSIYGVVMFADGVVMPIVYGTIDALQPAVGYNWGTRDFGRVKRLELWCYGTAAVLSVVFVIVCWVVPEPIVRIFIPDATPALMAEACLALRIFSAAWAIRWMPLSSQLFLIAVGEVMPSTVLSVCSAVAIPLPAIWLLSPLGLAGLWANQLATSSICAIIAVVLLIRFRKKVRLMATGAQRPES